MICTLGCVIEVKNLKLNYIYTCSNLDLKFENHPSKVKKMFRILKCDTSFDRYFNSEFIAGNLNLMRSFLAEILAKECRKSAELSI